MSRTPMLIEGTLHEAWVERGACVGAGPDAFYPVRGRNGLAAKAICAGCTVRAECLTYAIDHAEQFGVWGGLDIEERRAEAVRRGVR